MVNRRLSHVVPALAVLACGLHAADYPPVVTAPDTLPPVTATEDSASVAINLFDNGGLLENRIWRFVDDGSTGWSSPDGIVVWMVYSDVAATWSISGKTILDGSSEAELAIADADIDEELDPLIMVPYENTYGTVVFEYAAYYDDGSGNRWVSSENPVKRFSIEITPTQDAPTNGSSYNETTLAAGGTTPITWSVFDLLDQASASDPDGDDLGLLVTGVDASAGTFTVSDGSSVYPMPVDSIDSTNWLPLPPGAFITFTPGPSYTGGNVLTYQAWDGRYYDYVAYTEKLWGAPIDAAIYYYAFLSGIGVSEANSVSGTNAGQEVLVNNPPIVANPATPVVAATIDEDSGPSSGISVANLLWSGDPAALSDADYEGAGSSYQGVAIVGLSGNGTWQAVNASDANDTTDLDPAWFSDASALLLLDTAQSYLYFRFTPAENWNGTASLTVRGWDGAIGSYSNFNYFDFTDISGDIGTSGTGACSADTLAVQVIVNPVNDAPVIVDSTPVELWSVAQDSPTTDPVTIASILASNPQRVSDSDGPKSGFVIVGLTGDAAGTWEYALDNGQWHTLPGTFGEDAPVSLPTYTGSAVPTQLRFTPAAGATGTSSLIVRAGDGSDWGASTPANGVGDATAYSADTLELQAVITPANHPPVILPMGPFAYASRGGFDIPVTHPANASDPDGDAISFAGVIDPEHGSATFDGTHLWYVADASYWGEDYLTYSLQDDRGGLTETTLKVYTEGNFHITHPAFVVDSALPFTVPDFFSKVAEGFGVNREGLSYSLSGDLQNCTVVVAEDGTATVTPDTGFVGIAYASIAILYPDGAVNHAYVDFGIFYNTAPVIDASQIVTLPGILKTSPASQTWDLGQFIRDHASDADLPQALGVALTAPAGNLASWQVAVDDPGFQSPTTFIPGTEEPGTIYLPALVDLAGSSEVLLRCVPTGSGTGTATLTIRAYDGTGSELHPDPGSDPSFTGGATSLSVNTATVQVAIATSINQLPQRGGGALYTGLANAGSTLSAVPGTWTDAEDGTVVPTVLWEQADDAAGANAVSLGTGTDQVLPTYAGDTRFVRLTISATDSDGGTGAVDTGWLPINRAPFLGSEIGAIAVTDQPYDAPVTGDDPDAGQALTITVDDQALPAGLTYADGRITGSPTSIGTFIIPIQIDDGIWPTVSTSATITVYQALAATPIETPAIAASTAENTVYGAIAPGSSGNFDLLAGALAGKANTEARAFWWDAAAQDYRELPQLPTPATRPWSAVFLAAAQPIPLTFAAVPRPAPFAIELKPGWTFFGVPTLTSGDTQLPANHPWTDFRLETAAGLAITSEAKVIEVLGRDSTVESARPYAWDGSTYTQVDTVVSGRGYWIRNNSLSTTYRLVRRLPGGGAVLRDAATAVVGARQAEANAPAASVDRGEPPAAPGGRQAKADPAGSGGCGAGIGIAGLLLGLLGLRRRRGV